MAGAMLLTLRCTCSAAAATLARLFARAAMVLPLRSRSPPAPPLPLRSPLALESPTCKVTLLLLSAFSAMAAIELARCSSRRAVALIGSPRPCSCSPASAALFGVVIPAELSIEMISFSRGNF
ncbi:hypothetical protein Mapa_016059 [Marchantia paleacea]|nr:hypothetical protein Mapa_016059 [Marchantia paleacea]